MMKHQAIGLWVFILLFGCTAFWSPAKAQTEVQPEPTPKPEVLFQPVVPGLGIPPEDVVLPPRPQSLLDQPTILSVPRKGGNLFEIDLLKGPLLSADEDIAQIQREKERYEASGKAECIPIMIAGMSSARDRNFDSAEEFLVRANNADCSDGLTSFYLASIYEEMKRLTDATRYTLKAYQELVKTRPNHRYRFYCSAMLGRMHFRLNEFQKADLFLDEVVIAYPDDVPHLFYAGVSALRIGKITKAQNLLERAVVRAYKTKHAQLFASEAHMALAQREIQLRNFNAARPHLIEAIRWNPKNAVARELLNQVDAERKRANELDSYENVMKVFE